MYLSICPGSDHLQSPHCSLIQLHPHTHPHTHTHTQTHPHPHAHTQTQTHPQPHSARIIGGVIITAPDVKPHTHTHTHSHTPFLCLSFNTHTLWTDAYSNTHTNTQATFTIPHHLCKT